MDEHKPVDGVTRDDIVGGHTEANLLFVETSTKDTICGDVSRSTTASMSSKDAIDIEKAQSLSLKRSETFDSTSLPSTRQGPKARRTNHHLSLQSWFLPTFTIVVPMLLLSVGLLSLTLVYWVREEQGIFPETVPSKNSSNTYILVDYPATRILFISSWSSTLAPYLGGCVMALWMFRIARGMLHSSSQMHVAQLPNAQQYGHVIGLSTATIDKLYNFVSYARRSEAAIPLFIWRAAIIVGLTFLFSSIVFVCDTVLHYTTNTVQFSKFETSDHVSSMSRVLSEECLALNRSENQFLPCSVNLGLYRDNPEAYTAGQNEVYYLQHNNSQHSEIRILPNPVLKGTNMAVLLPQTSALPQHLDYRASTIGASTECNLISEKCLFRSTGPFQEHSAFNCSPEFWGLLGVSPVISLDPSEPQDPNVPPQSWKPSYTLQFAFFMDSELQESYNTAGVDPQTGWGDPNLPGMADEALVNPVYFAVAARTSVFSKRAGVNFSNETGFFQNPQDYLDFTLACYYQTFDVSYTWSNGTIHDVWATTSSNGTIAEIYHGSHLPGPTTALDADLQDYIAQAVMQGTIPALTTTWSDLYSTQVMSVIGAFLAPAPNIAEQTRTQLLVSKIPLPVLALLIASCLAYSTFGLFLGLLARNAHEEHTYDLVSKLNVETIIQVAFEKEVQMPISTDRTRAEDSSTTLICTPADNGIRPPCRSQTDVCRIGVLRDPGSTVSFKVFGPSAQEEFSEKSG